MDAFYRKYCDSNAVIKPIKFSLITNPTTIVGQFCTFVEQSR